MLNIQTSKFYDLKVVEDVPSFENTKSFIDCGVHENGIEEEDSQLLHSMF